MSKSISQQLIDFYNNLPKDDQCNKCQEKMNGFYLTRLHRSVSDSPLVCMPCYFKITEEFSRKIWSKVK